MRRFARTTVVWSMLLLAAAGSTARGQETVEEEAARAEAEACSLERARAAAFAFLAVGPGAPRPDVTWAQVQAAPTRTDIGHVRLGGPVRYLFVEEHTLQVAGDGCVISFRDPRQFARMTGLRPDKTRRTVEEIEAECLERIRFTEEECHARAIAFLRSRYPDYEQRRFKESGRRRHELTQEFVWHEEAGPGVLAVYGNYLGVHVSAETGEVERYDVTNWRIAVRTPPPVTEARARELASQADARPIERVVLIVTDLNGATPRPYWSVRLEAPPDESSLLYVDAYDGTVGRRERY
jgi:hypothetical protein